MVSWRWIVTAGLVLAGGACATSEAKPVPPPVDVPVDVPVKPVEPPPTVAPATFDFRLVHLDPTVIGTNQTCDVTTAYVSEDGAAPIVVGCAAGVRGSSIALARTDEVLAAVKDGGVQIEVRIDREAERGADAEVTLIRVSKLAPPPRETEPVPCRCLDREFERIRDAERAAATPEAWDFALYDRDHKKHWGTTHVCEIGSVHELARSSPDAREYSIGRVFTPETLPYAARVYCHGGKGGTAVIVGARSPHQLLRLEAGQYISIELGWVDRWYHGVTGKLVRVVHDPDDY